MADAQGVEEVLRGHSIAPLPENEIVIGAIMLVKAIGTDGEVMWYARRTDDMSIVEEIGALRVMLLRAERNFLDRWEDEEDDA